MKRDLTQDDPASERALTRWLAGEMAEEESRAFEARLAVEPALARSAAQRRRTWESLVVPPSAPGEGVPPGFAGRVMAHVRQEARHRSSRPVAAQRAAAPGRGPLSAAWSRLVGGAALTGGLIAGLVLGVGLSGSGWLPVTFVAPDAGGPPSVALSEESASTTGDEAEIDGLAAAYGGLYADLDSAEGLGGTVGAADEETTTISLADDYASLLSAAFAGEEGT